MIHQSAPLNSSMALSVAASFLQNTADVWAFVPNEARGSVFAESPADYPRFAVSLDTEKITYMILSVLPIRKTGAVPDMFILIDQYRFTIELVIPKAAAFILDKGHVFH